MSSGGGGTNTVTQQIPDWMQGYIQNNYQFGKEVASIPNPGYSGQGTAPINAQEQAGIGTINGAHEAGAGAIQQGINAAGAGASYSPTNVGYQGPTAANIQQYLSPYLGQVMDTTNTALRQQGDIANQQTAAGASAAGAYGGSRQAVQTALNNYYTGQNIAQADANIQNQGYSQALNQASTNAQANLAAQEANQQAGLSSNAQRLQGAVDLGAIGQGAISSALGAGQAQLGAGQLEQQTQQNVNNFNYGQWYNQLMWPYQQLSALTGSMYGGSVGGSTSQPLYQNNLGNAAGTGIAAGALAAGLGASSLAASGIGGGVGLLALLSDPDMKTDRAPVTHEQILDGVKSLPVERWRYKPEAGMGDEMHIGPMADEFAKRFGGDGKSIPVVDALGVHTSAIKALAAQVERLQKGN